MSLRKRLIISNTSIVILPLIITILAGFLFVGIGNRIGGLDTGFANFRKVAAIRYDIYAAAETIWNETPSNLARAEFAQYLSARLEDADASVILLTDRTTAYSDLPLTDIDTGRLLELKTGVTGYGSLRIGSVGYMVSPYAFDISEGSQGRLFILIPVDRETNAAGIFILAMALTFLITFLTTNVIHSGKLSRSIVKPLERLQRAVGEISRGNLQYPVVEEGDEEIRDVLRALEQMRLKLDESVHLQLKYDDNRKMLITSISHDLKTPITSIKGYVEGILDGVAGTPEKKEKYLKTVYAKAVQVDRMIDDLILYSKLDLNQIPFQFERTDFVRFFEDCLEENEPEMAGHGIAMTLENRLPGSCFIMMDRERMRRVVLNLLENARKYMDKPDGRVDIILRETPESAVAEIADNGAGIPKDSLPQIFERFYRADASRGAAEGSGLGLSIAREIVEGHGGQIWATSREHEGARFMISLRKVP